MSINDLHKLACSGDKRDIERLFANLSARFRLFTRQRVRDYDDAEEIVQEALKVIYEKYAEVDFEQSFAAWAYTVLNNKIMTTVRTRSRREKKLEMLAEEQPHHRPDSGVSLERRLLECLRKLGRVNTRYARIVNLHHLGYSVAEICDRLQLTRSNLYTILFRARSLLEQCLEDGEVT